MRTFPDFPLFVLSSFISALSRDRTNNCIWELTYRCNARCDICSYWRNPTDAEMELKLADLKIGLDKIYQSGCRFVNFSGGEPTLREDLEEIISYASCKGFWTSIVTNGSLLDLSRIYQLKKAGLDNLFVSLDFVDGQKHDELRRIDGLYDKVIDSLIYLGEKFTTGHRTAGIMCVISKLNSDVLKELVELAKELGVYIVISRLYFSLQAGRRYKEHEWQYTPSWQRSQYTYYGAGAEVIFPNSHIGISTELGPGTVKWNSTEEGYNSYQGQFSYKFENTSIVFIFNVGIHFYF